jgi:hypothetical protein
MGILPPDANNGTFRKMAELSLQLARVALDGLDPDTDPLQWWPKQDTLSVLFPLAKMLFGIPASTAENERSYSSAGFTLSAIRSLLSMDNFRMEHRIRRFICAGADSSSSEGRKLRVERCNALISIYERMVTVMK